MRIERAEVTFRISRHKDTPPYEIGNLVGEWIKEQAGNPLTQEDYYITVKMGPTSDE